jgi:hypothetical protein
MSSLTSGTPIVSAENLFRDERIKQENAEQAAAAAALMDLLRPALKPAGCIAPAGCAPVPICGRGTAAVNELPHVEFLICTALHCYGPPTWKDLHVVALDVEVDGKRIASVLLEPSVARDLAESLNDIAATQEASNTKDEARGRWIR